MRAQIFKQWDRIRSSFWFLPTVMALGSMALSFASVAFDERVTTRWLQARDWTFTGGGEGASALLGVVAGSMISLAGVVFSMTLVALSLTSSQLGPRLLRTFMRDTATQVVLGTFVSTFLYCLLVLLSIRRGGDITFVPHLSVTLGVLFAVASVGVLIYFIHHVSVSIQANEVVARVGTELIEELDRQVPEHLRQSAPQIPVATPDADFLDAFDREADLVNSADDGYLQFIDTEALMALAEAENVVIRVERRPGHYVVAGTTLVRVWPGSRIASSFTDQINSAFALGKQRTSGQDLEFAVDQLVEIAVRALSPGLNDPFTAMTCVDRLGSALSRLAARDWPSPYHHDTHNQLRLIAHRVTFPAITDAAFNQIREYGRASVAISIRLLETIAVIGGFATRAEDHAALIRHAQMIVRGAREALPEVEDRRAVERRYLAVIQCCGESTGKRL